MGLHPQLPLELGHWRALVREGLVPALVPALVPGPAPPHEEIWIRIWVRAGVRVLLGVGEWPAGPQGKLGPHFP